MKFFAEAVNAVQRNLTALALYLAITVSASALKLLADAQLRGPDGDPLVGRGLLEAYGFGADLFLAGAYALAQTLAFAGLGQEIDKPLWKIAGPAEALRRFFLLWFLLDLLYIALVRLVDRMGSVAGDEANAALFLSVCFPTAVLIIPVGACVMFFGRFQWRSLGESLRPLAQQFPKTLVVLLFNGCLFFFGLVLMARSPIWTWPVVDVVVGYGDCMVFAGIWLLCIHDRNAGVEDHDFDAF